MSINRRRLLQGLSLGVLSANLPFADRIYAETQDGAPQRPTGANDRFAVGVIGPGSRGQELIRQLLRIPDTEIAAVCDVYEPRFAEVNELVGKKVSAYKDYRELLTLTGLDAIFIATPPAFHAQYTIAALESGRPVYQEKTLGFTPEENKAVVDAVQRTGQLFQIGHQMRYGSWIREAVERIHKGEIGEATHVYAYWHRTDNWRRSVPNPKLEHLLNWRLYQESSGGLLEELGSHDIDFANWVFQEQPHSILGTTSIVRYNDGRTVGDNVQAVLSYSKGRRMFFSSLTDNVQTGDSIWVYGSNGSVEITLQDATFYGQERKTITAASHTNVVNRGLKTGASYATAPEMPYRGAGDRIYHKKGESPTLTACKSFIECVRQKKQPFAGVKVGYGSGMTCAVGKTAVREARQIQIPQLHGL